MYCEGGSVLLEGMGSTLWRDMLLLVQGNRCPLHRSPYFPISVLPLLFAHTLLLPPSLLQKASSVVCGEAASRRAPGRDLGKRWAIV